MHRNSWFSLPLSPRNEGKIKSYESCFDFRAWSHDRGIRARYLVEWMKSNMPPCVPFCSISTLSRSISMRFSRRLPPRCNSDCNSKVILESIAASCHAIKECMMNDDEFNELFQEEEFETSHWPCDRCLEALKTITMFWKYLVRKVFCINIPDSNSKNKKKSETLRTVTNQWQKDILRQASYVTTTNKDENYVRIYEESHTWNDLRQHYKKPNVAHERICKTTTHKDHEAKTKIKVDNARSHETKHKKAKVKTAEVGCLCKLSKKRNDTAVDKFNLELFKKIKCEVEQLERKNTLLKEELNSVYKTFTWKSYYNPEKSNRFSVSLIPKDNVLKKPIDSETIITVKACKEPVNISSNSRYRR